MEKGSKKLGNAKPVKEKEAVLVATQNLACSERINLFEFTKPILVYL